MKEGGEDLDEQFVFSAFNYFDLFQYIHYGPIKIWKSRHLIDKEIKDAYLCNKKYFNAGESAVALLRWTNINKEYEQIHFDNDIDKDFVVKKVHKTISDLYKSEGKSKGICVVEARNYSFASPRLTGSINDSEKYGKKWVSEENLLKVLPLFCACRDEFAERGKSNPSDIVDYRVVDTVYKSSDLGTKYQKDSTFLENCLLFSLCTQLNQCSSECKIWEWGERTLPARLKNTDIWKLYKKLVRDTGINGLFNIEKFNKLEFGKLWREHNLYPKVCELKDLLREFYNKCIRPDMFKYELLK